MKVVPLTGGEIIWRQSLRLVFTNPLTMNDYYSQLFNTFKQMFEMFGGEEDKKYLDAMIKTFEEYVSDDLNPMTLEECELRMFQNMDLLSGLQVRGAFITQQDMLSMLNNIKSWLNNKLWEYMTFVRFTQSMKVD